MKTNTIIPMDDKEFEIYTQKITDVLGDEVLGFFNIIYDVFRYFVESDAVLRKAEISFDEFKTMVKKINKVLGKEESARFFKAVYGALPKETVKYLGVMISVFEAFLE